MRVIAQEESFLKDFKEKHGFILLENKPMFRSVFYHDVSRYEDTSNKKTLPFPYVQYLIGYTINEDGYNFHGYYEGGLRVSFSNKPFSSFSEKISPPWTEGYDLNRFRYGLICTTHMFDPKVKNSGGYQYNLSFKTLHELASFQISLFWGATHNFLGTDGRKEVRFIDDLFAETLDSVCNKNYKKYASLSNDEEKSLLEMIEECRSKHYDYKMIQKRLYPNINTKILDKEFHKDWKLEENSIANSLNEFKDAFLRKFV